MSILIVEDEAVAGAALASLLKSCGYVTAVAGSAEAALERLSLGCQAEVALVDLDLPGMSGAQLIARLEKDCPDMFTVLITAEERQVVGRVLQQDTPYLRKPLNFKELLNVLGDRGKTAHC